MYSLFQVLSLCIRKRSNSDSYVNTKMIEHEWFWFCTSCNDSYSQVHLNALYLFKDVKTSFNIRITDLENMITNNAQSQSKQLTNLATLLLLKNFIPSQKTQFKEGLKSFKTILKVKTKHSRTDKNVQRNSKQQYIIYNIS